jgi:kynurenine formamidase
MMASSQVIDLTHQLDPATPVFPNYPPVSVEILQSTRYTLPDGRRALNSSRVSVGLHCGTHMDAPFHFFDVGRTINEIPLEQCVGTAVLIRLTGLIRDGVIDREHLRPYEEKLNSVHKLVFETGWSEKWGTPEYFTDHPVLTADAANLAVDWGVELVAVDFPSVDRPPFPAHVSLLSSGAVIVENLTNLAAIRTDLFQLVVLPLRITGRDGSPVRAIALELA